MKKLALTVLNGSPKGNDSVTLQYVRFIQKKFPEHDYKVFNVAQLVTRLDKDEKLFMEIMRAVASSDAVLWSFPLYFLFVCSQYKRFIELVHERRAEKNFRGRYAAAISTSIHFFDHTAHEYIQAIAEDMGMRFAGSHSPDMFDLMQKSERERLLLFAHGIFETIAQGAPVTRRFEPLSHKRLSYRPGPVRSRLDAGGRKILVLTDERDTRSAVSGMARRFADCFSQSVDIVNLYDVNIKGGCQGCIRCGYDYECAYTGKDGYIDFFNEKVRTADILVLAGTIRDRYLSSRWKLFFDRSFFNTHTPVYEGKQVGFLISGPLRQIHSLRLGLSTFFEIQGAGVVDFVTDECDSSKRLDEMILDLARRIVWRAEKGFFTTLTFPGVAGRKVFRDDMFGRLRFPFRADHLYFKNHDLYDFPHKNYKARLRSAIMLALAMIPSMRREIYVKRMRSEMVKPLRYIVNHK